MKHLKTFTGTLKRILMVLMLAVTAGSEMISFADKGNTGLEPIHQTGRKWIWVLTDVCCDNHSEVYFIDKVVGDSIMPDGRIVKVIERNDKISYLAYENEEGVFIKREPDSEFPEYDDPTFLKQMAFNVEVGDSYFPGRVSAIENLTFLNHTRKTVFFGSKKADFPNCWIEGIGSPVFLYMNFVPIVLPTGGWTLRLDECWQDDELIYSMEAFNVANSMKELADVLQTNDGPVYDLFGREIADPQPGTVYIRNGRKFVTTR